jgi:hypothetical protein
MRSREIHRFLSTIELVFTDVTKENAGGMVAAVGDGGRLAASSGLAAKC